MFSMLEDKTESSGVVITSLRRPDFQWSSLTWTRGLAMRKHTWRTTLGLIAWDFLAFPNITHLDIVWRLEIWCMWRKTNPGPRTIAFYILLQRLAGSGRWPCSSETDSKRPNMHAHLSIPRLVCLGNIFPWHAHTDDTVCVNISLHLFTRRKFEAVNDDVMGFQWISFLPRDCLRFWVRTVFKNCLAIVVSIQPHVFKDFGSMEARIWKILELYIYIQNI